MDMCVIAFILVVVCFYVLLPIAIISEIIAHLPIVLLVVALVFGVIVIMLLMS